MRRAWWRSSSPGASGLNDGRMRLFVAVDLSDDARERDRGGAEAASRRRSAARRRRSRWVKAEPCASDAGVPGQRRPGPRGVRSSRPWGAMSTWRRSTWFSKASACSRRAARRGCCGSAIAERRGRGDRVCSGNWQRVSRALGIALEDAAVPSASHARPLARVAPVGSRPRAGGGAVRQRSRGFTSGTPRCTKAGCRRRVPTYSRADAC